MGGRGRYQLIKHWGRPSIFKLQVRFFSKPPAMWVLSIFKNKASVSQSAKLKEKSGRELASLLRMWATSLIMHSFTGLI